MNTLREKTKSIGFFNTYYRVEVGKVNREKETRKKICKELNINKDVTTYYARHSYATVMKRNGAPIAMISDGLGHSSISVTENYLDGFELEQIQEQTQALIDVFKKAN